MINIISVGMWAVGTPTPCPRHVGMPTLEKSIAEENTGCKNRWRDPMKYLIIRKSQQLMTNETILSGWVYKGANGCNVWHQSEWNIDSANAASPAFSDHSAWYLRKGVSTRPSWLSQRLEKMMTFMLGPTPRSRYYMCSIGKACKISWDNALCNKSLHVLA